MESSNQIEGLLQTILSELREIRTELTTVVAHSDVLRERTDSHGQRLHTLEGVSSASQAWQIERDREIGGVRKTARDLEERVRVLEMWQWKTIGMALGGSAVVSIAVALWGSQ